MSTFPTPNEIVSRFLYNQATPPSASGLMDDQWIRDRGAKGDAVPVSANDFMTSGGGRFVSVANFNFVRRFLDSNDYHAPLAPGVYTTLDLLNFYQILDDDRLVGVKQYYLGVDDPDYISRAYVFGSSEFKINDDALFYVNPDGTREIAGICVEPVDDNFNYESSNIFADISNTITLPSIDPSGIGRTVPIDFTGSVTNRINLRSLKLQVQHDRRYPDVLKCRRNHTPI